QHVCGLDGNCYAICGTTYCYGSTPICGQDYECHAACPTGSSDYCINGSVCLADGTCSTTSTTTYSTYTSGTSAPTSTGSQAASGGSFSSGGGSDSVLSTGAIIGIAVVACVVVAAVVVAAVIFFRSRPSRSDNAAAKLDQAYQQYYATPGPGGPPAAPSIVDMSSRAGPPSTALTPHPQPQSPPAGPLSDFSFPPDATLRQLPGSAAAAFVRPDADAAARFSHISSATAASSNSYGAVGAAREDSAAAAAYAAAAAHYAAAPLPVVSGFTPPVSDDASTAATSHTSHASHSPAAAVPAHQLPKIQGVPVAYSAEREPPSYASRALF
ncbi:hypothetical protein HK405_003851, partial [Cladochytrium tenue]